MTQLPSVPQPPAAPPAPPQAAAPPPPVAPLPPTSGMAIASLVLGTVAVAGAWLCCGLGFPTSAVAIILGHFALSKIRRSGGRLDGRSLAIAGLVMGYLGLVLQILVILGWIICATHTGACITRGRHSPGRTKAARVAVATRVIRLITSASKLGG